jgi:hypothetical protein
MLDWFLEARFQAVIRLSNTDPATKVLSFVSSSATTSPNMPQSFRERWSQLWTGCFGSMDAMDIDPPQDGKEYPVGKIGAFRPDLFTTIGACP